MAEKMLDPNLWNISELFKSIYQIPVYQRPYSWEKEQTEVLLTDIIDAYNSKNKYDGYYIGNILIYDVGETINGNIIKYDIIDGQQRITTFAILLMALYVSAISLGTENTNNLLLKIKDVLWKCIIGDYKRDLKTVTLNSIEKQVFSDLYDHCYDSPKDIEEFCDTYECSSKIEKRVLNNFSFIREQLQNKVSKDDPQKLLAFSDYCLNYVKVIAVIARCQANNVFSMFESLNSKGKKLDDIDLIKTYIFSKLDPSSYEKYSKKWGKLIIKTNDRLYDYLYIYIKAYIQFYSNRITDLYFKALSKGILKKHFKVETEAEAFEKLIDDMYNKVAFYNMLFSQRAAYKLIGKNKFRFYYNVFTYIDYQHPKALFFRIFNDYSEGKISKSDVEQIVVQVVGYMMKFLTINSGDSKDTITVFRTIMSDIYKDKSVSKDKINMHLSSEIQNKGLSSSRLKNDLTSMDAFNKNRKLTVSLLSIYESTKNKDGKNKTSYDEAWSILNTFITTDTLTLDHILVQKPNPSSSRFRYYRDKDTECLVLKDNSDFPEGITNGMEYNEFLRATLNKIGNLRIYYRDENAGRGNSEVSLRDYSSFNSYSQVQKRMDQIIDTLIDYCLPTPEYDKINTKKLSDNSARRTYPRMAEMISLGLISPGDKIYILSNPDSSVATLIDGKNVMYNGERVTLNEWGQMVKGWSSIDIYEYAAILGEEESLHQKRIKYLSGNN